MAQTAQQPTGRAVLDAVVDDVQQVAAGVVALTLKPVAGELPAWSPGAHIDLVLAPDLVRQYSLCGDPADRSRYRVAVLLERDGRGGSAYVHDHVRRGTALEVRGPRNAFGLDAADDYVFIAGGIGITPLLPMVHRAQGGGARWRLVYGGRTRRSMAFLDELPPGGDIVVHPQDERGLIDVRRIVAEVPPGGLVYCCGPEGLITAVEAAASDAGVGVRTERFRSADPPARVEADADLEVVCAGSRVTVEVPAGTTILAALTEAGIDVPYSCAEGTCGTCETRVLDGHPDHRDSLLTDVEREAGETMMVCVSRARGRRLVLDL